MTFTIAIVNYNARDLLDRCLAALAAHPPEGGAEVVVVDNASEDGSVEMLRERHPQVRLIASEENLGFAAGSNLALQGAQGDMLVLLNPDTEARPGALDMLAAFLQEHPQAGAVGPRLVGPGGELELSCHPPPGLRHVLMGQLGLPRLFPRNRVFGGYDMTWWGHDEPRRVGWISGACLAIRREAWERVGPLDEGYFLYYEDADWCLRLAREGFECWYAPQAEVMHHEAGSWRGASRARVLAAHRSAFRYFRKHHGRAAEGLLRLLVAEGALARAALWALLRPLRGREGVVTDPGTHFAVAREALGFRRGDG